MIARGPAHGLLLKLLLGPDMLGAGFSAGGAGGALLMKTGCTVCMGCGLVLGMAVDIKMLSLPVSGPSVDTLTELERIRDLQRVSKSQCLRHHH